MPNITGDIKGVVLWFTAKSGCFNNSPVGSDGYLGTIAMSGNYSRINFNASLASPIYGSSSTVTPISQCTLMLIKY